MAFGKRKCPVKYEEKQFSALPCQDQKSIKRRCMSKIIKSKAKAVYECIRTEKENAEAKFVFPAEFVVAMAKDKLPTDSVVRNFVKKSAYPHGMKGVDYIHVEFEDIGTILAKTSFNVTRGVDDKALHKRPFVLDVPGKAGKQIKIKYDHRRRYTFLTASFVEDQISQMRSIVGEWFRKFHHLLKVEMERYLNQKQKLVAQTTAYVVTQETFVPSCETQNWLRHNEVRDQIALSVGGTAEKKNRAGIADVESDDAVYEVKPTNQWLHGVGQVLGYATATQKKPILVLFGSRPENVVRDTCDHYEIELVYFDQSAA